MGEDWEEDISRYVISHNEDVIKDIKRILDIDQRMEDFTVRKNMDFYADNSEFKFYPLSNYSRICNLPDDIDYDIDDWSQYEKVKDVNRTPKKFWNQSETCGKEIFK